MQALTDNEAKEKDEELRTIYGKALEDIATHMGSLAANDPLALQWFVYHLNNVCRGCLLMAQKAEAGEVLDGATLH